MTPCNFRLVRGCRPPTSGAISVSLETHPETEREAPTCASDRRIYCPVRTGRGVKKRSHRPMPSSGMATVIPNRTVYCAANLWHCMCMRHAVQTSLRCARPLCQPLPCPPPMEEPSKGHGITLERMYGYDKVSGPIKATPRKLTLEGWQLQHHLQRRPYLPLELQPLRAIHAPRGTPSTGKRRVGAT